MARDPLRSTLDNLKVDPAAAAERPYLESALRRMGYTESEIRAQLGEPAAPKVRPTEYRLVRPVIKMAPSSSSPFEDLLGADFEAEQPTEFEAVQANNLDFEEVPVDGDGTFDVAFEAIPPEEAREGLAWDETQEQMPAEEAALLEEAPLEEQATDDFAIDQLGRTDGDESQQRTRVRVRRVRAGSRQEAEAKVAGEGRRIIKSIPVDIVERWGPGEADDKGADGGR